MLTEEAARLYIARGWCVVPIPAREKGPIIKGWPDLRITDPGAWFDESSNIGVILGEASGIVCVDLDHELARELAPHFLPPTSLVSGRGEKPRTHWFYIPDAPVPAAKYKLPQADANGKKLSTVELLSTGNQVVVGPSIHPDGDVYEILEGEPSLVNGTELAAAVRALHATVLTELGLEDQYVPQRVNGHHHGGNGSADGYPGTDYDQRGDVRGLLVKHGWEPLFVSGCNEHWRRPGKAWGTSATLKDGRIFYCFTSSSSLEADRAYGPFGLYAALECGGDLAEATRRLRAAGYGGDVYRQEVDLSAVLASADTVDDAVSEPEDEPVFPGECLAVGGLLAEIMQHNLATALYPQPELALAAAIAVLGTITGRKVCDSYGTRTNVLVLGLGLSGTGKEHARKVNKELLLRSGCERMIGSERVGSHAGIVTAVCEQPAILLQLDEIGRLLETCKDARRSPHLYACITVLMQLYTSSSTLWKADAYADSKKVKTIDQPHLCLYGTATPDSFWHSLSTENIGEGLMGRLMVFEGRGYEVRMQRPGDDPVPTELLEAFRWWHQFTPGGNLGGEHPAAHRVPHAPEAAQRYESHIQAINERRIAEDHLRAAVWSRSGEKANKLALIHACSRARGLPSEITREDTDWGIRLANYLTRRLLLGCREHVSENEVEGRAKRVLRLIGAGVSLNELTRKTQWLRSRERSEILADLVGCGLVVSEQIQTTKRPKTVLKRASGTASK